MSNWSSDFSHSGVIKRAKCGLRGRSGLRTKEYLVEALNRLLIGFMTLILVDIKELISPRNSFAKNFVILATIC